MEHIILNIIRSSRDTVSLTIATYLVMQGRLFLESIQYLFNPDAEGHIRAKDNFIHYFIRFYIAKAYYLKGVQTIIDLMPARTTEETVTIVSKEVTCHRESIGDAFGELKTG